MKAKQFVFSVRLPVSGIGRGTSVLWTLQDKETGDELGMDSIIVNDEARDFPGAHKFTVHHPKNGSSVNGATFNATVKVEDPPPGRDVTLTTTIRDVETGDEVESITITLTPQ